MGPGLPFKHWWLIKPGIDVVAGVLPIPPFFDPKFVMRIGSPLALGSCSIFEISEAAALAAEYLM